MGMTKPPSVLAIKLPAIGFRDGWLSVFGSTDGLSRSSRRGFNRALYKSSIFVDSTGTCFKISDAKKIRTLVNGFGDFIRLLSGNANFQVEFTFAAQGEMPLVEVKKLFSQSFDQHPDYWEEMTDFETFRSKVEEATTLNAVFALLKKFNLL
jgi:hypothetical protein